MNIFDGDLLPMQVWATRAEEKMNRWAAGQLEGVSTGFKTIDPYLRLVNSEYTLIAARPSMGKTSMGMQIAENMAKQLLVTGDTGCVCVFSAEMSGTELTIRMASALSGVNAHSLRNGLAKANDFVIFREALQRLKEIPVWIDDSTGPTTQTMLTRLEELNKTNPVRMMLFDFVELGGDSAPNEELRISSIHKHLKGIAKTLDIPVVGLSQLRREVESRADKMPQLADLRYSGMGEQIADKIAFIMRPEYYIERQVSLDVPEDDRKGVAYVMIAKNRNGPVGMTKMAFIKERSMFGDLARGIA
jgi:replicative DNA helicase